MNQWFNEMLENICASLRENILQNMSGIFDILNQRTAAIGTELSKTPQSWNSGVFNMIKNLSDNVIVPIAGMILTLVLCYEVISILMEKNNMHEVDTSVFFRIILKMGIAVYLLGHTFEIAMAVFDIAQKVIQEAVGVIADNELAIDEAIMQNLENINNVPELIGICIMTWIMQFVIYAIGCAITIVLYGRFIEIYIYCSVAPIPFSTFANKEWGQMGTNYVRGLMALAFQGFFMLVCVAIYNALIQGMVVSQDMIPAMFETVAYSVLLVLALFKTSQISKSIFNAH